MSAAPDSRHEQRVERILALFSWQFFQDLKQEDQPKPPSFDILHDVLPKIDSIDATILQFAPKHSLSTFNKIDLAILRQGLYELQYTTLPKAVVIDEAVEIAKAYGSEDTPSFVHGVLASYVESTDAAA